jgi:purine-binding chemotaxis protein CheW
VTISHGEEQGLANLREAFDQSFARPRELKSAIRENFLAVRVAGHPYLIRLSEVASLHARRQITAIPSAIAELIGVAGFRGTVSAVYDLRALLGHSGSGPLPWVVLVRTKELLGLAFDLFEGHVSVASYAIARKEPFESVRLDDSEVRPVLQIASVVEALERRIVALPKES